MPRASLIGLVALLAVAGGGLAACDTDDGRALTDPPPGATAPTLASDVSTSATGDGAAIVGNPPVGSSDTTGFGLGSSAFANGSPIPADYACDGTNQSPPLNWSAVPTGTVELAVTVVDLDSEDAQLVHWAVAGLDPTLAGLDAGTDIPLIGGVVARNYTTEFGWAGPCPPAGETHRYVFTLYALTERSNVTSDATGDDVVVHLQSAGAVTATLTGTYTGV